MGSPSRNLQRLRLRNTSVDAPRERIDFLSSSTLMATQPPWQVVDPAEDDGSMLPTPPSTPYHGATWASASTSTPDASAAASASSAGDAMAADVEEAPSQAAAAEQEKVPANKVSAHGIAGTRRNFPFFTDFESAMSDLELKAVRTEHGGLNNCLFYAFKLSREELAVRDQKKRCAHTPHRNAHLPVHLHHTSCLPRRETTEAIQGMCVDVHNALIHKLRAEDTGSLPQTSGWSMGMDIERVRFKCRAHTCTYNHALRLPHCP